MVIIDLISVATPQAVIGKQRKRASLLIRIIFQPLLMIIIFVFAIHN